MARQAWLLWLLLPSSLALAEPTMDQPAAGVLDPAEAVDHARTRRLSERVEGLVKQPGLELLIVFQRGEEQDERTAADWLKLWQPAADEPEAEPPTEAPGEAGSAEDTATERSQSPPATAPLEEPRPAGLPRGVMVVRLAPGEIDFASSEGFDDKWPAGARERVLADQVKPSLTAHDMTGLLQGLLGICDQLSGRLDAAAGQAQADVPIAPARVAPPRPWLNGWLFVGLPVLVWMALLAWRHGGRPAVLAAAPMALLYGGLYFLLAFQPVALIAAGILALTPLWLLLDEPMARPAPAGAVTWWPGASGFGQTGFGGFGSGAWGSG